MPTAWPRSSGGPSATKVLLGAAEAPGPADVWSAPAPPWPVPVPVPVPDVPAEPLDPVVLPADVFADAEAEALLEGPAVRPALPGPAV